MQTKVQNINNFQEYIKCGEILKSPIESCQLPYVLKCFLCKEMYILFESFIFHLEDHCKNAIAVEESHASSQGNSNVIRINSANEEQMQLGKQIEGTNLNLKVEENNCTMQTSDPLIVIKPECFSENDDNDSTPVKEEIESPDAKTVKSNVEVNNDEKYMTTVEEVYETEDSIENNDTNDKISEYSSDEEIDNISDSSVSDDDNGDEYVIKKPKNEFETTKGQTSFITDFFKSKSNVKALIESYKNQPSLWNKNFPFLKHKLKRQNILQQMAKELNEQHNINITWNQVANVIVRLCRKYREDLKGIKNNKQDEKYIPSWYFEDLQFLKPFIENNPIAKLDSHMPDLEPEQIKQILEIYKGFPDLWNTQIIEHYCKNKTSTAKKEMLKLLETKMNLKITEPILEDYFRTINNYFTRVKRTKTESKTRSKNKDSADDTKEDYYQHMIFLYDHVGFFKCSECKRSFKSPLYLKMHQTQDHGFEPPSCSLCQKQFKTVNSYTSHAKRHMEDFNHECRECGKKFLHSNELRIHMRNHTGAKPFCCEICGASFRHIQGFSNHHRRHIKNYLHTCKICSKGFYSKDRYNDHMNSHSNTRSQICNVCGKAFITKRSLQQHVVVHDDVRRHACKLCGKTFKHKTGVNQHMRTHGVASSEEKSAVNKDK